MPQHRGVAAVKPVLSSVHQMELCGSQAVALHKLKGTDNIHWLGERQNPVIVLGVTNKRTVLPGQQFYRRNLIG